MKKHIFDEIVIAVSKHTKINKEDIFTKTKFADIVLARQTWFYLCYQRGLTKTMIAQYMNESGYDIGAPAVYYSISVIDSMVKEDPDFRIIMDKISNID